MEEGGKEFSLVLPNPVFETAALAPSPPRSEVCQTVQTFSFKISPRISCIQADCDPTDKPWTKVIILDSELFGSNQTTAKSWPQHNGWRMSKVPLQWCCHTIVPSILLTRQEFIFRIRSVLIFFVENCIVAGMSKLLKRPKAFLKERNFSTADWLGVLVLSWAQRRGEEVREPWLRTCLKSCWSSGSGSSSSPWSRPQNCPAP